jgi:magnesium transporter
MRSPTVEALEPDILDLLAQRDLRTLRESLRYLPHADTAELLSDLEPADAAIAFRVLPRDDASGVFANLPKDAQESLIRAMGEDRSVRVVEEMEPDDRARLLDELPVEVSTMLMAGLSADSRRETQAILGYGPEQVGRLMTPDYVRVRPYWTVARTLDHIRRYGRDAETLNWIYVVDNELKLIDDLPVRHVLLADPASTIADLMDNQFVALDAADDREEAVLAMARYDRSAMPVVDARGLLVGIVTHDDVTDVAEAEATEDAHKMGAMEALGRPYLEVRPAAMIRKRGPWLVALFALQIATIAVMAGFKDQLETAVVLALFVPLIISTGGNTGTQTASIVVRALALREVSLGDWGRVLRQEVTAGLLLGLVLGIAGFGLALMLHQVGMAESGAPTRVGAAVAISVVAIVVWAVLIGSLLPLLLEKLKADPATSSAPLVATLMDVSGLTIYLAVSTAVLTGAAL